MQQRCWCAALGAKRACCKEIPQTLVYIDRSTTMLICAALGAKRACWGAFKEYMPLLSIDGRCEHDADLRCARRKTMLVCVALGAKRAC